MFCRPKLVRGARTDAKRAHAAKFAQPHRRRVLFAPTRRRVLFAPTTLWYFYSHRPLRPSYAPAYAPAYAPSATQLSPGGLIRRDQMKQRWRAAGMRVITLNTFVDLHRNRSLKPGCESEASPRRQDGSKWVRIHDASRMAATLAVEQNKARARVGARQHS